MNWSALGAVFTHLHFGWALTGWALSGLLIAALGLRWRIFLRAQEIELSFSTILSLTWAGQFFNSFLPGSTGEDVVKIYQICRLATDRKAAAVATVFVDRLTALLALVVLAGIAFVIDPAPLRILSIPPFPTRATVGWLLASLVMVVAATWLLVRFLRSTHWGERPIATLKTARGNLSFNRSLLAAVLLAFAIHLANFLVVYFLARALGISITRLQILLMMPVVLFLVMLPVTINGHGLREMLLIGYFTQMGVTLAGHHETGVREIAIALSLLLVTNDLLWSIPGGIWYLVRLRAPSRLPGASSERA